MCEVEDVLAGNAKELGSFFGVDKVFVGLD
jgi:hypothetical protein